MLNNLHVGHYNLATIMVRSYNMTFNACACIKMFSSRVQASHLQELVQTARNSCSLKSSYMNLLLVCRVFHNLAI